MATVVTLLVLGAVVLAAFARSALRVVPEGYEAVVVRAGRAIRTVSSGLVVVVPALDRVAVVALRPPPMAPVVASGTTADGAEVRVVVCVSWEVVEARRTLGAAPDTATVIEEAVVRALHHLVAGAGLADLLRDRHHQVGSLPRVLAPVLAAVGVRVADVDLLDLEVRVGAELLRLLEPTAEGRGHGRR
jgi:regulator of protease activity HflC (stomatin/prohibitin superfamily)